MPVVVSLMPVLPNRVSSDQKQSCFEAELHIYRSLLIWKHQPCQSAPAKSCGVKTKDHARDGRRAYASAGRLAGTSKMQRGSHNRFRIRVEPA
jgi:hypothetical protein